MAETESKPIKAGAPWWLILVTLLGSAFLVQRSSQLPDEKEEPPPEARRGSAAEATGKVDERLLAPLREFLGMPSTSDPENKELGGQIQKNVGLLDFLIVMVADPIETSTNYRFDLQLDTLHKALGVEGYIPDHYYLPWDVADKSSPHRTEPGVLLYRRSAPSKCDCSKPAQRTDLLLVYLVGETPTTGIHPGAFREAVKQLELLGPMACRAPSRPGEASPPPEPAIRVAGPLFTGGADSLALAIRQARDEKLASTKFQVITGTAVSIQQQRFHDLAGAGNADLHSTVLYGNILRQALIDHVLERTWASKVRIAWLTETGTAYGSRSSVNEGARKDDERQKDLNQAEMQKKKEELLPWYQRIHQDMNQMQQQSPNQMQLQLQPAEVAPLEPPSEPAGKDLELVPPPPASTAAATPAGSSKSRAEIVEFRFPVNISKVRGGYAEKRRRERQSQASLGPESSRLPIPFDDTKTARDVPPMQTPKVTAPTVELLLSQILMTIRNEGIKFVGISSSDPRDPIFLAELIKEQAPDVQIMLVTSDVLHLHSEYRSIMHGTLVSSTHPLHPESQDLCFPFGEELQGNSRSAVLSSQTNYGLYNAIIFLRGLQRGQYVHLREEKDESHDEHPSNLITLQHLQRYPWPDTGLPLGYSMPFQNVLPGDGPVLRPPVWISRISSTGICPITVRPTNNKDKAEYTFNLQIARLPKEAPALPIRKIHSRIPTSLYVCSLVWLVAALVYFGAMLIPRPVGNWAKALQWVKGDRPEFQGLVYVFRSYIACCFIYVLIMFGQLMYVYDAWIEGLGGVVDWFTYCLNQACWWLAVLLFVFVLWDLGWTWWGVGVDLFVTGRRSLKQFGSDAAIAWRKELWRRARKTWKRTYRWVPNLGKGPSLSGTWQWLIAHALSAVKRSDQQDLAWHLITARIGGLVMIMVLVTLHITASVWQRLDWLEHKEDTFLWFKVTSDMWNGLSPAMTAQLLSVALIVLAYGMLLQMHLLSREFTITRPDVSTSAAPSEIVRQQRRLDVRSSILFPLLSRWRRDRPVVLDLVLAAAAIAWLAFLGRHLQSPDYCAMPVSFPTVLLLFTGAFWCLRLFKLVAILKGLIRHLEDLTRDLRHRWPDSWAKVFELLPDRRVGLQELFWSSRPTVNDPQLLKATKALEEELPDSSRRKAEQTLAAVEIELYVRQSFHHIVRLGLGLVVSACLLFLCAQAFPYSQEPLLRLSASVMLAAIGCVMTWYYLKFDRNELLSYLVGTEPKRVSINWSMIQAVAPALLLTIVALLSHAFPEIWQWMRGVLEPMARSSI